MIALPRHTMLDARPATRGLEPPVLRVSSLGKHFVVRRSIREVLAWRPPRIVHAIQDVSFDVQRGEILGLLGPNGAGKSTLLKILSTLVLPDTGSVELEGCDVVRNPSSTRRVLAPVTADERSLDWRLSAVENLRFFGALQGMRSGALRSRISDLLERVGLADVSHTLVATYSSGMRQRLLIARALLGRPRVLLLDEPTRSLDPIAARSFREFLRRDIVDGECCTVILATHDADEAFTLCNRVAILDRGRLLALGATAELAADYGERRYRLWSRSLTHAGLAHAQHRGSLSPAPEHDTEGWFAADLVLDATQEPGDVLAALIGSGVHIARFEQVKPTLADLLDRVMSRGHGRSHA